MTPTRIRAALLAAACVALSLVPRATEWRLIEAGSAAVTAPVPPPARVTVEHELVEIPATVEARPANRTATRRADLRRTVRVPVAPEVRRAANGGGLSAAGRAFIGDGRFRPEPFPRVR